MCSFSSRIVSRSWLMTHMVGYYHQPSPLPTYFFFATFAHCDCGVIITYYIYIYQSNQIFGWIFMGGGGPTDPACWWGPSRRKGGFFQSSMGFVWMLQIFLCTSQPHCISCGFSDIQSIGRQSKFVCWCASFFHLIVSVFVPNLNNLNRPGLSVQVQKVYTSSPSKM
jgi:hypothetical protein